MVFAWRPWRLWFRLQSRIYGMAFLCLSSGGIYSDALPRFVHERGFRTAVFNLGVLGGINLAVPIGGLGIGTLFHDHSLTLPSCCNHRIQFLSYCSPRYGRCLCFGANPCLLLDARVRVHERSFEHRHGRNECKFVHAILGDIPLTLLDCRGKKGSN